VTVVANILGEMDTNESPGTEIEQLTSRIRLPQIDPRAYEHPADRGALATLRTVPGFAGMLRVVSGAFAERGERLLSLSSSIRVGPKQYPRINQLRLECASILDVDPVPEVFVTRDPVVNAMTIGLDAPFIVLTTGLVELMDTDSLRWAIGHEIGHALSGHALYRTMLLRLLRMMNGMSWLPVGYWGLRAIVAALMEWFRKAELSADRAGLLCGQDPQAALQAHVLLAGASGPGDVDTAEFLNQAREYESDGDVRDSVLKLLNTLDLSHPLAVVRAAELQRWAATEEYRDILAGNYPRRGSEPHTTWTQDVKEAAKSYKDSFSGSTDPLAKVLNEVGGAISDVAGSMWRRFGGNGDSGGNSGQSTNARSAETESTETG
jgi:Zn-dependent protease with chaperone function